MLSIFEPKSVDDLLSGFHPEVAQEIEEKGVFWNELSFYVTETLNNLRKIRHVIIKVNSIKTVSGDFHFTDQQFMEFLAGIVKNVEEIKNNLNDTRFYVGVFGEFSAGKSTFINAFTEHPFLPESTVGGTTCVPTYLRYADEENIHVTYLDGSVSSFKAKNFITDYLKKISIGAKKILDDNPKIAEIYKEFNKKKNDFIDEKVSAVSSYAKKFLENNPKVTETYKKLEGKQQALLNASPKLSAALGKIGSFFGSSKKEAEQSLKTDSENTEEELRLFLHSVTADESESQNVAEVIWECPAEVLKSGLTIVDTPGIATSEERTKKHSEIALKAAKACDVLLVITSLSSPLSEELLSAVREIAGDKGERCIFVGTRTDQVREKERERLRLFFAKRLQKAFGCDKPFFFVSAYQALEDLKNSDPESEKKELCKFREFRGKIVTFLNKQREYIQCGMNAAQISSLLPELDVKVQRTQEKFAKKIEDFRKTALSEDAQFWEKLSLDVKSHFRTAMNESFDRIVQEADAVLDELQSSALYSINACSIASDIKKYIEGDFTAEIQSANSKLETLIKVDLAAYITENAKETREMVKEEISSCYADLEAILGSLSTVGTSQTAVATDHSVSIRNSGGLQSMASDFESDEDFKIGGGLAAGIGLGLLIPGAGWIVAGVLGVVGGIIGTIFADVDKKKREVSDSICSFIEKTRGQVFSQIRKAQNDLGSQVSDSLLQYVDEHRKLYMQTVALYNRRIEETSNLLENANKLLLNDCRNRLLGTQEHLLSLKERIASQLEF